MSKLNRANINAVYLSSTLAEKRLGFSYYEQQYSNLESFAICGNYPVDRIIAAFAALSPNNQESTNYKALASCIAIARGIIPSDAPVIAFNSAKHKALTLLMDPRMPIEEILQGPKTYAFYRNTLDPDNDKYMTIDGHMYNIWANQVINLQDVDFPPNMYAKVSRDFKFEAVLHTISPARFQSILWLTWKRIHNIVSSDQLSFESGYNHDRAQWMIDNAPRYRTLDLSALSSAQSSSLNSSTTAQLLLFPLSCHCEDGESTPRLDTSTSTLTVTAMD